MVAYYNVQFADIQSSAWVRPWKVPRSDMVRSTYYIWYVGNGRFPKPAVKRQQPSLVLLNPIENNVENWNV